MKAAVRRLVAPGYDPQLEAIHHANRTYTHAEWVDAALAYAAGLSAVGIEPGDRVAVLSDNRPEVLFVTLGHLLSGVIHVPINTRYRAAEIGHILADSGGVRGGGGCSPPRRARRDRGRSGAQAHSPRNTR